MDNPLISLDLSRHCIETEIKKRYNRRLADYFKAGSDKKRIEAEIELLGACLEKAAFNDLRSRHKTLAGGSRADVKLTLRRDGQAVILIDGHVAALLRID